MARHRSPARRQGPIVVGLLGCGTVGGGVVEVLTRHRREITERLGVAIEVRRILVRDVRRPRGTSVDRRLLTTRPREVLGDPAVEVVVELVGGLSPAREMLLEAIHAGKHVVTANKALLALGGQELFSAARAAGVTIAFEGAVGGGIPVIRAIREGLVANRIRSITGIINGTANFILTSMDQEGTSFAQALAAAREKGYAEADPTLDVNGSDTAHKLAVLAACAWGVPVPPLTIPTEGIARVEPVDIAHARSLGFVIKSLGVARLDDAGLSLSVHPAFVGREHVLATVSGPFNAIHIDGDPVGPLLLYGRGAGAGPTASAVVGDLLEVGRDIISGGVGRVPLPFEAGEEGRPPLAEPEGFVSPFYLRFSAYDRPGVLARIAGALGAEGISIASVVQKEHRVGRPVPVLVLTHACPRHALRTAVAHVDGAREVVAAPTVVYHAEGSGPT